MILWLAAHFHLGAGDYDVSADAISNLSQGLFSRASLVFQFEARLNAMDFLSRKDSQLSSGREFCGYHLC